MFRKEHIQQVLHKAHHVYQSMLSRIHCCNRDKTLSDTVLHQQQMSFYCAFSYSSGLEQEFLLNTSINSAKVQSGIGVTLLTCFPKFLNKNLSRNNAGVLAAL